MNSRGVDFEYLAVAPHFLSKLLLMAEFFKISSSCKHVTPYRCKSVVPWLGQFKQMITSTCVWLKVCFCSHKEKSARQFSTLGDRLQEAKWTVLDSLKLTEKFCSSELSTESWSQVEGHFLLEPSCKYSRYENSTAKHPEYKQMFSTALSMEDDLRDGLIVAPLCGSLKGLL